MGIYNFINSIETFNIYFITNDCDIYSIENIKYKSRYLLHSAQFPLYFWNWFSLKV